MGNSLTGSDDPRCSHCGNPFPKTRATRKYCTPRCKTYACLDRSPSRLRAADVKSLYELLNVDFESTQALRERLRDILAPEMALPAPDEPFVPPDLD
jgi:hypothetical protein